MPLSVRHVYVVMCDVCRAEYTDPETEVVAWFEDETSAEQITRADGWLILARPWPDRFICPRSDADHQARMDDLMPPEPVIQIPGQLGLDGTEEPW
ncbi:hypothetical protein [Streptomyces sp. NBC_01506]|uniref:hypothetical protein n=1 Tax=Streptomyces sp. NBC_01506 TaxID=2903887 RepID=UPI00386CBAA1